MGLVKSLAYPNNYVTFESTPEPELSLDYVSISIL